MSTNYSILELFAGAGGLALGLENAGLKHRSLIEIDKDACATLTSNRPYWDVICEDVNKIDYKDISVDIITGGFPCQSFSIAGRQLGFKDIRGTLFFELIRAISTIRPKVVLCENVKGLVNHDQGNTLRIMVKSFNDIGYKVSMRILRAQYLDVPQKRERLFMICVKKDLDIPFLFPKELPYVIPLKEALKGVPNSIGFKYSKNKKEVLDLVPQGGYWRDLPVDVQKAYMGSSYFSGGGKTGMARRLDWNSPSLTLTCSPAQKQTERCHPEETRPLSIREYARIQTFPDTWEFKGSMTSVYKQIGNAVPVNMGFHIGRCLTSMLDNKYDPTSMIKEIPIGNF